MDRPEQPYRSREAALEAYAEHVSRGRAALFTEWGMDVVMGHREGPRFHDAFSEACWINCHCNGGVFNLGHRHPRLVAALRSALESLDIGNHHLLSGWRARLAERLAATTEGRLPGVVFGVSGGEAIDLALKVARGHTGRQTIVSAQGGYHGHTGLALAAGDPQYRDPFGPNLPGFVQVPFDDLGALDRAVDDGTAAVILEPVPATLGMPIPSEGYLGAASRLCHERGALLIVDEVQTGLGRTGRIWGHRHDPECEPDLLVTGKGLSGGLYPLTATLMTREVHAFFDHRPFVHISTFGGAELGCPVALEVLEILGEPGFLERVAELSDRITAGLKGLDLRVRRRGLMMGLAFDTPTGGMEAARRLYAAGVFAAWANNDPSVLQFLPPLVLTDADVEELVGRVREALA